MNILAGNGDVTHWECTSSLGMHILTRNVHSLYRVIYRWGLAKLIASLLTSLGSLETLGNNGEGFGDLLNLLFSEEWVKRIYIPKKEGH